MLFAVLLAAALSPQAISAQPPKTAIQRCFGTMDGAVYHGDPSDRRLMKANVDACEAGIVQINAMRTPYPKQGPEKLFITGRILDRAATLSFMGLDDAATALREVKLANLYFRVASGLTDQTSTYHEAALANVELTRIQLRTLRAERAVATRTPARARMVTAYHKP
jgi:hypothetical protein